MFDAEKVVDTFVSCIDFCDAGAVCCLFLSYGFPSDGAASTANNITREGSIFKEFKWSTVSDGVTELATPAGITKTGKLVTFGRGRRSCICVCFFVVMMGEVIEGLKSVVCR